jgi:MYXO-CTERM domain-containing protein
VTPLGAAIQRLPRSLVDAILAGWFVVVSATLVLGPLTKGEALRWGWDAVVYVRAGQALLNGGNPWLVSEFGIGFAAPPPSLLPYLPFVWLPDTAVAAAWVAIAAGSAVYAVRRLSLPWWWLAFPPVVFGVLAGSSAPLVLALLVRGGVIADAAAVVARVYAALPLVLLARWRGLVAAGVVVVATAPFVDWPGFAAEWSTVVGRFVTQTSGGASSAISPPLFALAALALLLLGRRRAAWLIVPALWPYTQLYYASIALPVLAEMPLVALAIASPATPGLIAVGLAAQVVLERVTGRATPAEPPPSERHASRVVPAPPAPAAPPTSGGHD